MNPIKMNRQLFLTLTLLLSVFSVFAQQTFKYQAKLPKVETDGFYRVDLSPELIAGAQANLGDIRILNQKKQFSPYIFGNQLVFKDQRSFIAFPKLKALAEVDTVTTFIVENAAHLTINQLSLQLRNASVKRNVNLSGSDDLKKWYAIKENISLEEAVSDEPGNGTYQQQLNFPSSSYRYLRIQINNENKEPVAILQAGIYRQQSIPPVYVQLKKPLIQQRDSAQVSYITVRFNAPYQLNKLHLEIAGQKYYKRNVRVYAVQQKEKSLVADTLISTSAIPNLYFSAKTNHLELEIVNGDNPPLVLHKVNGYQLSQSLISYLEKDQDYTILFGDGKANAPDYDLKFFGDSLQQELKPLNYQSVSANPLYQKPQEKSKVAKGDGIPGWVIWAAIVIVAALLGFLTFKMTQEVSKRDKL
ncbi:hypothetical protein AY601_4625 [Pedobacter cryoconitis]|uniref:DUF3999 domain-containing protein n=2 Tax=Pedobacter cryoconitis TaxID=188932 RepID=A0A127VJT9_9SPHI|nr:hypothetical protein AY601_4625 [Pedobacter cryoconitis]